MKEKIKIILVAGARPNFMKIAPLMKALRKHPEFEALLVHTGQHYDDNMSGSFFSDLEIPQPDINLGVGSTTHARQTARIMEGFETVCLERTPRAVLVVGDVNSTAACTMTAAKMQITTIHYEAGLRSRDKSMPEEINRLVTDSISDLLLTTCEDAGDNLLAEGHGRGKIFFVGNLMIDSLVNILAKPHAGNLVLTTTRGNEVRLGREIPDGGYGLMTFHRPGNVDKKEKLEGLVDTWIRVSDKVPLVFPIHPRTWKRLREFGLAGKLSGAKNLFLVEPTGYLPFTRMLESARFVVTDSGGIQEETTYLNIPCLTVRPNTERPVTIRLGSNKLVDAPEISREVDKILKGKGKTGTAPPLWDGKTAGRIVQVLREKLIGNI